MSSQSGTQIQPSSPKGRRGRFNPTLPAMVLGLIVVVAALWWSMDNIVPPARQAIPSQSGSQSSSQSGQQSDAPEPNPEDLGPVLTSASIFSWQNDNGDYPDLASSMLDGNPDTVWRSRWYFGQVADDSNRVSILLNLSQPALVTSLTIDMVSPGAEVIITNASAGDPRTGEVLTAASLDTSTVITLPEPTEMSAIGIIFDKLPTDSQGRIGAQVTSVTVE